MGTNTGMKKILCEDEGKDLGDVSTSQIMPKTASYSVQDKGASPVLTLKLDNSFPPHMSLAPFKLLFQCWSSEQVNP